MSNPVPKVKKSVPKEISTDAPKAKRGRKKPTNEEKKLLLGEEIEDVKKLMEEFKSEQSRFASQAAAFPKIADLLEDELADLAEEQDMLEAEYEALSTQA